MELVLPYDRACLCDEQRVMLTMVGVVRSGKPITKRICIVCMCTESGVV